MENEGINYSDYFVVDPESPTGLRWRDDVVRYSKDGRRINHMLGKPAGVVRRIKGRADQIVVNLSGKIHIVSRVIWTIVNGEIPEGMIIDHLDGNGLNNKIGNLACKTLGENMQNRKLDKRNNTGVPGVSYLESAGVPRYLARYQDQNKKARTKAFRLSKYGDDAFKLACEWRLENLKRLNEEYGLKYTERHFTGGV